VVSTWKGGRGGRGKSSMCPLKEELPINGCKCKRLMDVQMFLEKNWVEVDVCMYV